MFAPRQWLYALIATALLSCWSQAAVLIETGSDWRYFKGQSEASAPDKTAWRQLGFDDSSWLSASAPFFYGDPLPPGTVVNDMQNRYSTLFFRKKVNISGVSNIVEADLDLQCDDGFIAWINGRQVASALAPTDPNYNSLASGASTPDPAVLKTYSIANPRGVFAEGENIVAIQVFNVSLSSSDIVFDSQLLSVKSEPGAPVLVQVSPFPGLVTNLTSVTVDFNENVVGVDAGDLLVNQVPATQVVGSGSRYTFTFPQPAYGSVQFSWAPIHGIQDMDLPANVFDRSGVAATFVFDLVDPVMPQLQMVQPPAGITLKQLHGIEVRFNKAVTGIDATDLLVNGQSAIAMAGTGAGPYIFEFVPPGSGTVQVGWKQGHGIVDAFDAGKPFVGSSWSYTINPSLMHPLIRISEFLAHNENGRVDEDGSHEDWIELHNPGAAEVNLQGWSLTDDMEEPGQWVFPSVRIPAGGRILVYASGKDRRDTGLHTNFKLSVEGEFLGLYSPDSPRILADGYQPEYPQQRMNISYGIDANGKPGYFNIPTPLAGNGSSNVTNAVSEVYFSAKRGFYSSPFQLSLASETPGAEIRYTRDGSEPTTTRGLMYTGPITINSSAVIRAAAFKTNHLPSRTATHTYLYNIPQIRRHLPALSLATATNNLYGVNGIMESNPRNTTKHGIAWERPVSVELIKPQDNSGFQVDAGIRVAGGDYIRGQYEYRTATPPQGKYSFRLYFRNDYGPSVLKYPFFPGLPVEEFDAIHLRAGMNDHTNPFIKDEMVRALQAETGHVVAHGTFVNLFLNGVYKGYYNPTERYDDKFLKTWHGGGDDWDLIGAMNQEVEGDGVAWNQLRNYVISNNPTNPSVYLQFEQMIDMENYIDYFLPQLWSNNDDWPHNNTRAARERVPGAKWRFYVWDTEFSFGGQGVSYNTFNTISSTAPPWGTTDYQRMFNSIKRSPEFRLLFADRVHKHFFNDGALTDENIRKVYDRIRLQVQPSISGFNNVIGSWITSRRRYLTNHFQTAGMLASSNAPVLNQFGGRIPRAFELTMSNKVGQIYYTTNGADPRTRFTGAVSPEAKLYTGPVEVNNSFVLKARSLSGTNWSAVTEAAFGVDQLGVPIRITEIMYNPPGGDAYEFVEIMNIGGTPVDLAGMTLDGISFRFAEDTAPLPPGERLLLASDANPAAFALRYGSPRVAGYFDNSLSNGGEILSIKDRLGNIVTAVAYDDESGWDTGADGEGYSLEIMDPGGDMSSAANWGRSAESNGTPGQPNSIPTLSSALRLNEIMADNKTAVQRNGLYPDFIELENSSSTERDIGGWSITDDSNPTRYVIPSGTIIPANGFLVIWMDTDTASGGLHSGFRLDATRETISLFTPQGVRADAITYGQQLADLSLSRTTAGEWTLGEPTPGAANVSVQLAELSAVKINEFLANPTAGQKDWVELFNSNPSLPASIGGMYLSQSNAYSRLPAHSFISPGGFAVVFADEAFGPLDLSFKLPASGGNLALYDHTGMELHRRLYGLQPEGISSGLYPDGSDSWTSFAGTASPGASNYLFNQQGPVIHEVLAWNSSLAENGRTADWIELHNPLATEWDLGGWGITLGAGTAPSFKFPPGTAMAPGSYLRVWADAGSSISTNPVAGYNLGVSLNNRGGYVNLLNGAGQLADKLEYGFQVPNKSIGLSQNNWLLLSAPTPAAANSAAAELALLGGITFNEWMAAPATGDDWFELHNTNNLPVQIGELVLTDDPSMAGRTNTTITRLSFIAPNGFVLFQADGRLEKGPDHTRFSLNDFGETLRLLTGAGTIVAELNYFPQELGISEGRFPDGGDEIRRFPGLATPGTANGAAGTDLDRDGLPDDWETAHGLSSQNPADAAGDADGDGLSNLNEFLAGTDPRSASSSLRLEVLEHDTVGTTRLTFQAQPNRSYSILYSDDIASGVWLKLSDVDAENTPRQVTIADPQGNIDSVRFYRMITPRLP